MDNTRTMSLIKKLIEQKACRCHKTECTISTYARFPETAANAITAPDIVYCLYKVFKRPVLINIYSGYSV